MASHAGFIVAAYAITAITLAVTVGVILIDYRAQRRMLARLERRLPGGGRDDAAH